MAFACRHKRLALALLLLGCALCWCSHLMVEAEQATTAGERAALVNSQAGQLETALPAQWLNSERPLKFEHLSTAQGLSQSTVLCILQDRQGFMWFGTQDGLNRYDGYEFRIYRHVETEPGSLRDNYILSLFEDRAGTLWVGTNKGGLNRYDPQTEQFTAYVNDPRDPESLSLNAVTSIVEDQAGYLWVATDGQGVNRFDRRTGKFKRFLNDPASYENRRANIVLRLYLDRAGTLWLGTAWGLHEFDQRTNQVVRRYSHDPADPQSLSHHRVQTICEDRDGALWIGTARGLNRLAGGRLTRFLHDPAKPDGLVSPHVAVAILDRHGTLWLGTSLGLERYDAAAGRFVHQLADPEKPQGLSGSSINALYEDRAGSLWLGVYNAGLNRYDARAKPFINFTQQPRDAHSLSHKYVWAFYEDRAGYLLVATAAGVDQLDPRTGQFSPLNWNLPQRTERTRLKARTFTEDGAGQLWAATEFGLAQLVRAPAGEIRASYFHINRGASVVYATRDGVIWLGTHGGGLWRFDPATKQFTNFLHELQNPHSLSNNLIYALREDRAGFLWVGTDQGLNRLDRATGRFTRFLSEPQNPASLSYNLIWSIYEDRAGRLWIGTGGGLNRFDAVAQRFQRFTEKDGLANGNILGILEDARGQLWLGTMKGVTRFDPETKTVRNYDATDGLFGNEVEQYAYYQNRAGVMFFGGTGGFSAFRPEQIQDDQTPPPVVLTTCRRYNTGVVEGSALVEPGVAARPAMEFSYQDNILTFEFAALSFRHSEKNQYAYQLAGYNDRWIQLGTKRDVTFTNLDAGNYTLRVRGANADGVWNLTGASLRIRIHPPFWRRWWFVGLELLAVAGLAWGAYRYRIAALQRRNAQQQAFARQLIESQEAERKRIAAELHDGLGQNLLVIKNRALFGLLQPDDAPRAAAQLTDISTTVSQALDEVRQIAANLHPYQLDRLGLTKALTAMIRKVGAAAQLDIALLLDDLDGVLDAAAQINLYRIVQEGLNNVVKHAAASEASVQLQRGPHGLRLTIRDNGRGFVPAAVHSANDGKGSFGLVGLAERARLLGGTLQVESAPGAGTLIMLTIPLQNVKS
jgi:signal transduction histidine kinase/ligand-binding sensor domain-containing protein